MKVKVEQGDYVRIPACGSCAWFSRSLFWAGWHHDAKEICPKCVEEVIEVVGRYTIETTRRFLRGETTSYTHFERKK